MTNDDFYWMPAPGVAPTGPPAISVPCGFTSGGLTVGLQIVGRRFADSLVLRSAALFERSRPWVAKRLFEYQ